MCPGLGQSFQRNIREVQFFAPAVAYPSSDGDEAISLQRKTVRPSVVESIINASARPPMVNGPSSPQSLARIENCIIRKPRGGQIDRHMASVSHVAGADAHVPFPETGDTRPTAVGLVGGRNHTLAMAATAAIIAVFVCEWIARPPATG